jgi:hypothetical protein
MRLSILADENTATLEPPVVMENADTLIPDLSRLADEEHPEITEYLFIGAPPAPWWQRVLHAAGLAVLAVVAFTTWLLMTSSLNDPGPQPAMSAAALPQQSMLASRQGEAVGYASPVDPLTAYAQFCQNSPGRCVPTAPTALSGVGYARFCANSLSLCAGAKPR